MTYTSKVHKKSEASFLDRYLMSFLNAFFLERADDTVIYSIIDGFDEKKKKKPDFMLGIEDRKREVYYFYIEVKRPNIKSIYQEEKDFVKLLKQMKASIDSQVKLGMKSPKSLGLLCEGFSSSLYQMTLQEEGVYISACLRSFQLVENKNMILNVVSAVEAFGFVKV
ncbi:unnamed protein product [Rhizopus stolonifer]